MDEQALQRLTQQLLAQGGNWDLSGINRAQELAGLLMRQGVTDLGQLKLQDATRQESVPTYEGTGDASYPSGSTSVDINGKRLLYGDKPLGYGDFGIVGSKGNYETPGSLFGGLLRDDGALATSYAGHGNVNYYATPGSDGRVQIMPQWHSSSDMGTVRDAVKAAAVMAALAYGVPIPPGSETAFAAAGAEAAAAGAGSLTAGITPASIAAAEAALPTAFTGGGLLGGGSALSQAGMATQFSAPASEFGSVIGLNESAIGGGLNGGFGGAAAGGGAAPYVMSSADKTAMLGNAGYGPGMTGLQTSAFDGVLAGTGSNTLAKLASDAAGTGLGSTLGNLSGKAIGGLLGAAAGAANSGDKQQTSQQRLDPRMEALLYGADGKGGYLGAATDWFNQNKGGNPLMLQGAQMMADYYKSPQYTEGYNSLRSTGLGLLGMGMAGNPFLTRG